MKRIQGIWKQWMRLLLNRLFLKISSIIFSQPSDEHGSRCTQLSASQQNQGVPRNSWLASMLESGTTLHPPSFFWKQSLFRWTQLFVIWNYVKLTPSLHFVRCDACAFHSTQLNWKTLAWEWCQPTFFVWCWNRRHYGFRLIRVLLSAFQVYDPADLPTFENGTKTGATLMTLRHIAPLFLPSRMRSFRDGWGAPGTSRMELFSEVSLSISQIVQDSIVVWMRWSSMPTLLRWSWQRNWMLTSARNETFRISDNQNQLNFLSKSLKCDFSLFGNFLSVLSLFISLYLLPWLHGFICPLISCCTPAVLAVWLEC